MNNHQVPHDAFYNTLVYLHYWLLVPAALILMFSAKMASIGWGKGAEKVVLLTGAVCVFDVFVLLKIPFIHHSVNWQIIFALGVPVGIFMIGMDGLDKHNGVRRKRR